MGKSSTTGNLLLPITGAACVKSLAHSQPYTASGQTASQLRADTVEKVGVAGALKR
ncbi:hypothetical protein CHELA1G11_20645 [Hyphomicrobiales bacterium]|nr:hypothetical protein CHELA1G11_20645 [Hyphomicrobiales bacterium]CAH1691217.1 hypothetical protein CHELA1G2_20959 [Hyphomicrobiales bacterium]